MIKDSDISIVVQGPILKNGKFNITTEVTKIVCLQLKKLFPKSELILSTWEGENSEGIIYDKLILNKDPGATWFNYGDYSLLNNCNRLLVSSLAGVKASSRKYVLKLRSDLFVLSKSFLNYFYQFYEFDDELRFVKNRIIAFGIFSLKSHRTSLFNMERPFHISDWAYFGYKQDIINLCDVPLVDEPEFSRWFLTRCKPFFDIEPHRLWRMPPEQYITSTFFKKNMPISLEHTADTANNNMDISSRLIVNNFLILDQTQFKMISLKYMNLQFLFSPLLSKTAIFFHVWLNDYCTIVLKQNRKIIKYKFKVFLRRLNFSILSKILTLIDGKTNRVSRLFSLYIKKCYLLKWER